MSTIPHERPSRWASLNVPDLWPSIAISVMWLAVMVDAIWGPNIETSNGSGTSTSSVPSGVVLALFAALASWAVAKYAFRGRSGDR
jgi:hypothetical protein